MTIMPFIFSILLVLLGCQLYPVIVPELIAQVIIGFSAEMITRVTKTASITNDDNTCPI